MMNFLKTAGIAAGVCVVLNLLFTPDYAEYTLTNSKNKKHGGTAATPQSTST